MFFKMPIPTHQNTSLAALDLIYAGARDEIQHANNEFHPPNEPVQLLRWEEPKKNLLLGETDRHTYVTLSTNRETWGARVSHYTGKVEVVMANAMPEIVFKKGKVEKKALTPCTQIGVQRMIDKAYQEQDLRIKDEERCLRQQEREEQRLRQKEWEKQGQFLKERNKAFDHNQLG